MGSSPTQPDQAELLRRLRAGDEQAFLLLVRAHRAGLERVARSFVASDAAAVEVVQETWRAFLEALAGFEGRASLKTFLYRILANQARTRAARDRRSTPLSALEPEGEEASPLADRFGTAGGWVAPPSAWGAETAQALLERQEAMRRLAEALERLPERQRAVVQLRDIDGLSAQEACEVLGVSEVHQRVLLHRARTRLRAELEAYFGG